MKEAEKQEILLKIQRNLNVSEAEAEAIYQDDKDIDKGLPKPYDLTAEQMANARSYAKVKRGVGTEKKTETPSEKKKRVPNTLKEEIVTKLFDYLLELNMENVEILNKDRQVAFTKNGKNFELTLVQKRQKK